MNNSTIVETARRLVGTPFVSQGRLPGVGLDCAGILASVAKYNKLQFKDQLNYNVKQWTGDKLLSEVEQNFDPIARLENASILLIWFRRPTLPQHFAIYTEAGTIIHTTEATGKVVEVQYDERWIKRTHSIWKFKEI